MSAVVRLTVMPAGGPEQRVGVSVNTLLVAGYTGRDREQVLVHIRELEALGVARPPRIPAIYHVAPERVTTGSTVQVSSAQTSGEAEVYIVETRLGLLVGAASDHTDRAHEPVDVQESKAMCPKPISARAWLLDDVARHWDRLVLRSWVTDAAGRRLYQEGPLGLLLPVPELLAEVVAAGYPIIEGTMVFGGTVPVQGGFVYGRRFEVELSDPVLRRRLTCAYDVKVRSRHSSC